MEATDLSNGLPISSEAGVLAALAASQPRAVRLFSEDLAVVWEDPRDHGDLRLLFCDERDHPCSIPPAGPMRQEWPVQRAWREGGVREREYLRTAAGGHQWVRVRAWRLPGQGAEGTLVAEEIEAIRPPSQCEENLRVLDGELSELIGRIASFMASDSSGSLLSIRLSNPYLKPCHDLRGCGQEDCPAYGGGAALRCWEVDDTFCPETPSAHDRLSKFRYCDQCEVFLTACPDPLTRIGENVNRLLTLLELKYHESLEAHQQVQQAAKMASIGEMALGIAHEIKNPLSIILGRLDCLRLEMDSLSPEEALEDLEVMRAHVERLRKIVENLMSLSRPSPPQRGSVLLNEVILKTLPMVRKTLEKERIALATDLAEDLPAIHADFLQIQQVVLNLILNAREALPGGGRLELATAPDSAEGGVWLSVADNGPGIAAEEQKQIFSLFYTTKDGHGGTGLGLSVCQRIVIRHGGNIRVRSAPGHGTVFEIWLPAEKNQP